jgi:hypothetical protein
MIISFVREQQNKCKVGPAVMVDIYLCKDIASSTEERKNNSQNYLLISNLKLKSPFIFSLCVHLVDGILRYDR